MPEKWCDSPHPGVMLHIIKDNGDILLQKRKGSIGAGTWASPGGWLDKGETPEQACLRELAEELGDDLKVDDLVLSWITNDLHEEGVHSVTLHYEAVYVSGEPKIMEPDKIEKVKWFSADKAHNKKNLFLPIKNILDDSESLVGDLWVDNPLVFSFDAS